MVIGLRIGFGVPEAIGDRFRAFGRDQGGFIAESLLLAQDREISVSAMRLSSVAELALSFKVTCRPNISCSSIVRLLTSGDLENSRGAEKGVSGLGSQSPYTNREHMSIVEYIS